MLKQMLSHWKNVIGCGMASLIVFSFSFFIDQSPLRLFLAIGSGISMFVFIVIDMIDYLGYNCGMYRNRYQTVYYGAWVVFLLSTWLSIFSLYAVKMLPAFFAAVVATTPILGVMFSHYWLTRR